MIDRRFSRIERVFCWLTSVSCLCACGIADREFPRVIEARLPVAQSYQDCAPADPAAEDLAPPRCGAAPSERERFRILAAVSSASRHENSILHSVAGAVALSPDAEGLQKAADRLRARIEAGAEPELWIAIGALEHALARATGDPTWLVDAFEHTQEALAQDPSSRLGLFNKALVATDLGLCRVARGAWRSYLEGDRSSPWASEARARLGGLPCSGSRGTGRAHAVDLLFEEALEKLLPSWTGARDPNEVAGLAAEIARLGEELAEVAGDHFVRRLAAEVASIDEPLHRQALEAYVKGRAHFEVGDYRQARARLAEAEPILRRQNSALIPWCDVWLAGIQINVDGRYAAVQQRLVPHLDALAALRSPMLAGRILWTSGLAFLRDGQLEAAYDRFADAERRFQQGGYSAGLASIRVLKAVTLGSLGFLRQSWWDRSRGLRALQDPRPRFALHTALLNGATVSQLMAAGAVAEALVQEAAGAAADNRDPVAETEALLWQARLLRSRASHDRATQTFEAALEATRSMAEEKDAIRSRFDAIARVGLWQDPRRAPEANGWRLQATVASLEGASNTLFLKALRAKASVERRRGDLPAALDTLDRAFEVIRQKHEGLGRERLKLSYLESRQGIFDEAMTLALSDRQPLRALELLEAARELDAPARSPAEILGEPRGGIDVARPEEDRPLIVVFALAGESLAWWRVDGGVVGTGTAPRSALDPVARAVLQKAPLGRVSRHELEALYDLLLEEPVRHVSPGRPLILVPDGYLQQVPWAALRNPATGAHLVEERAVTLRVSLRKALRPTSPEGENAARSLWRTLVVGDPAFDRARLPWLPRLAGARQEAGQIAELYGDRALLLVDESATARRLRREIASRQVLHLAAHATLGTEPSSDALALAWDPETDGSGLTSAGEILSAATSLRLVVLSACTTLGQRPSRSGGLLGLARAFVRRGVPATVGTLWPVTDRPQAELMVAFHRGLRRGLAASEALRRAQLEMIRSDPPAPCCDWAAVQIIGDLPKERADSSHET